MAGALVSADQTLAGGAVDNRHCSLVQFLCLGFVTRFDSVNNLFHRGTEIRTLAGVELTMIFRLAGAFSGLS